MGMRALRDIDFHAASDAPLALAFRAAGLIPLGRTNTPELASVGTCEPEAFGPTHNPWGLEFTPGGSSGGSAAAVAARLVAAAHANDISGSIRIPAAHCGLVGLKPTRGRSDRQPRVRRPHRDECRRRRHPFGTRHRRTARRDLGGGITTAASCGRSAMPATACRAVHPGVQRQLGRPCECATPPNTVLRCWRPLAAAWRSRRRHRCRTRPCGKRRRHCWPSTSRSRSTPGAQSSGESSARTTSRRRRGEWYRQVAAVGAVDLLAAQSLMINHTADAEAWWERFDLLVTPTTANAPTLLGDYAKGYESGRGSAFTRPFNITGQPAISVPLGWPDDGLPRGVQIIAPIRSRRRPDHGGGRTRKRRAVGRASGYGERMIVAVVNFDLPAPLTTDEARAMFEASAPSYQNVDGLLRKHYLLADDGRSAGGVYLWESRAKAEALYDQSWRDRSPPGMARRQRSATSTARSPSTHRRSSSASATSRARSGRVAQRSWASGGRQWRVVVRGSSW